MSTGSVAVDGASCLADSNEDRIIKSNADNMDKFIEMTEKRFVIVILLLFSAENSIFIRRPSFVDCVLSSLL